MAMQAVICPVCHGKQTIETDALPVKCKKCRGQGWLPLLGVKCPICGKRRDRPSTPDCFAIHFGE